MNEIDVKVWPCGCIETSTGGPMSTVYGTPQCAKRPDQCDELRDFWRGKVPDFELKLAAEYDDEV